MRTSRRTSGSKNFGHALEIMKMSISGADICVDVHDPRVRRTPEGCGGLRGENPAAFPQARPILQQPFSWPESAQTLAGKALRAAGKSGNHFPAASKFAGKPFQQGISDSHSLLEFSDRGVKKTFFSQRFWLIFRSLAMQDNMHLEIASLPPLHSPVWTRLLDVDMHVVLNSK